MIFVNPVKYCLVVLTAPLSKQFFGKTTSRSLTSAVITLSAIINKRIWDGVIEKKPKRDRKQQQKSELDRRLRSICTKLDECNVKAGIRKAVGDDKIADFTVESFAALKLKHPQRETCSVPDPRDIDCFSTSKFFVKQGFHVLPQRL